MIASLVVGRGGDELHRKHLWWVGGHSVCWYAIQAARKSGRIDKHFCSTDDPVLGATAEESGTEWIRRPKELCTAKAQIVDALQHALEHIGDCRVLVVVAANCATHKPGIIDLAIRKLDELCCDSVVTGSFDNNVHPWRVKRAEGNFLTPWTRIPCEAGTNRQQLPRNFILDHSVWVLDVERCFPPAGQPPWSFMGQSIAYLENSGCVDIHNEDDLRLTEAWLEEHGQLFVGEKESVKCA